jgi:G3E family GTPase
VSLITCLTFFHSRRDSGSAFPATLALQIRQLEPQGFSLDGVVTVIDCVNFRGYEDTSPSAKVLFRTHHIRPNVG